MQQQAQQWPSRSEFSVQKLRLQQTLRERGVGQDRIDHASAPVDLVARQIRIGRFFGLLAHAN